MSRRIALVTGASGGIGRAVCLSLAKAGMNLVIHYNKNRDGAEKTASLCSLEGVETMVVQGDLSNVDDCINLVNEALEKYSRIDVLINNSGITRDGLLIRMKEDMFDDVINTNLKSAFFMTKYVASHMIKKKYGRIVNISSVVGLSGNVGQTNYSASKAGLIGLTKSSAKELGKKGILVNAVAPGFVKSEMTAKLSDSQVDAILNQTVLGYMAEAEDVANLVKFLVLESNRYITGQVISIDGGMRI